MEYHRERNYGVKFSNYPVVVISFRLQPTMFLEQILMFILQGSKLTTKLVSWLLFKIKLIITPYKVYNAE